MIFYEFGDNSFCTRGYTWAYSLKPCPTELKLRCDKCTAGLPLYPKYEIGLVVEGGVKYPDILGCGSYPFLIVSQYVIDDWEKFGITGYEKYKANIVEAKGKRIRDLEPPQYYHIYITGRAQYDMDAMGFRCEVVCNYCGHTRFVDSNNQMNIPSPTIIKEGSWDGSDIFAMDITPGRSFCTEKILFLAGINERTNFRFIPLDEKDPVSNKGLDYKAIAKKMLRDKQNPFER